MAVVTMIRILKTFYTSFHYSTPGSQNHSRLKILCMYVLNFILRIKVAIMHESFENYMGDNFNIQNSGLLFTSCRFQETIRIKLLLTIRKRDCHEISSTFLSAIYLINILRSRERRTQSNSVSIS